MGNINIDRNLIIIVVLGVILVLLLALYFYSKNQTKKIKNKFQEINVKFNNINSIPLAFKLNKATSIAKIDNNILDKVNEAKEDFEKLNLEIENITNLIEQCQDLIAAKKYNTLKSKFSEIENKIFNNEGKVLNMNSFLDTILERENHERAKSNVVKDKYRQLKNLFNEKINYLGYARKNIEAQIQECSDKFSEFEEWMFASEFLKAKESLEFVELNITKIYNLINQTPELLELTEGAIPVLFDETNRQYQNTKQKGIYLAHLDVEEKLNKIAKDLTDIRLDIQVGNILNTRKELDGIAAKLRQLLQDFNKENIAYNDIRTLIDVLDKEIKTISDCYIYIEKCYEVEKDKFELADIKDVISTKEKYLNYYHNNLLDIKENTIENKDAPTNITKLAIDFAKEIDAKQNELKEIKNRLDSAKAVEDNARSLLVKFQILLNDMNTKISMRKLPSISDMYRSDLEKSYKFINDISNKLQEIPLNQTQLKEKVDEALNFIYTLHNNVDNVVSMAANAEDTIIFANKYRSSYPEIDSELTRAELNYHNGKYTTALTIVLSSLERFFPEAIRTDLLKKKQSEQ